MKPLVLLGGWVVASRSTSASSSAFSIHPGWGVVVRDGRIAQIAPNQMLAKTFPGARFMDCHDLALCPGFVNAHMHAYGLLAHGIPAAPPESGFDSFLDAFWWPKVEDLLDEAMILAACELACLVMIRSGFTAFCDVLEAPFAPPGILSRQAAVVERAGLRAVLSIEASERAGTERGEALLDENERFIRDSVGSSQIHGMQCIHTSFTCSEHFVRRAKASAARANADLHLHLSESDYEPAVCLARNSLRPAHWYDQFDFWDASVLASQLVAVNDDELGLLAKRGVRTAHMPLSNCEVGGGIAPVPRMIEHGLAPGLGTDGYINDPFEVMRGAFLLHKAAQRDATAIPAETAWKMATSWSAAAIGMPELGALYVGAPADLIGVVAD
nr:amidohydrolase family protein [Candidatus Bipolaricaulota bacterium]